MVIVLLLVLELLHIGIDNRHGSNIDDVLYAALRIGEVDRLVQTHLDGAYKLGLRTECLQEFVGTVGAAQVGEHECIDILALEDTSRRASPC